MSSCKWWGRGEFLDFKENELEIPWAWEGDQGTGSCCSGGSYFPIGASGRWQKLRKKNGLTLGRPRFTTSEKNVCSSRMKWQQPSCWIFRTHLVADNEVISGNCDDCCAPSSFRQTLLRPPWFLGNVQEENNPLVISWELIFFCYIRKEAYMWIKFDLKKINKHNISGTLEIVS